MNLENLIKYSVPFFVLAIVSRAVEEISFIYYAVPVLCVFFIVLLLISSKFNSLPRIYFGIKGQNYKVERETSFRQIPSPIIHQPYFLFSAKGGFRFAQLLPGLWFLLTSLWSSYPEVSALRALYFILISTGCISAGFLWLRYSGKGIFDFLLPANIFIVLLCLFSILTNIPSDSWTAGHGKGFIDFFGHQNLIASVLLFTLPAVFDKIKDKSHKIKERKVFYFFLFTLNLILLALTYSRSAILALIFGVIVHLILNKNWKVLSYSFIVIAMVTLVIYLTPAFNNFVDKIIKKDFPEVYSSRMWMWEPSYKAALEGGLFGLGYGISHLEIRSGEYSDRYENGRLIREKGNSALALIEETGLIGLVLFLWPILYLLTKLTIKNENPASAADGLKIKRNNYSLLILNSLLAALLLHSQFEAWWVGVGSVQLPLFFIYFGLLVQSSRFNSSMLTS